MKLDRYRLVIDDDGHYFVIPADHLPKWATWYETVGTHAEVPKWAQRLAHHLNDLTFTNPAEILNVP